jgi:predicted amidohydrolase
MKIACIQIQIREGEEKGKTITRAETLIEGIDKADLIILPEIWNIGYFSFERYVSDSETEQGETISRMRVQARKKKAHILAGSIVERENELFYNTSFLINPEGDLIGKYRKMHLFPYQSAERQLLTPGKDLCVIDTQFGRVGLSICYDLRFPEFFRKLVDYGAEIILTVSAWPYPRLEHWLLFNRVRAAENLAFLASANCAGKNREKEFCGNSMIVDPWGTIVAKAEDHECIVAAQINLRQVGEVRNEFPALADRVLI